MRVVNVSPFSGLSAFNLGRMTFTGVCEADFNGNGVADLGDIVAFVVAFTGGEPSADLDGDGVLDLDDLTLFISRALAGCG